MTVPTSCAVCFFALLRAFGNTVFRDCNLLSGVNNAASDNGSLWLICSLGRLVEHLNDGHRRRIPGPAADLQDSQIAAGAIPETGAEFAEQLADGRVIAQTIEGQTTASNGIRVGPATIA